MVNNPVLDLLAELRTAIDAAHRALNDLVAGDVRSSREVYRRSEDITLFGAYRGYEAGWSTIDQRLDAIAPLVAGAGGDGFVTVETLAAKASGDLAYTVELERHTRSLDVGPDHEEGANTRTLRVTQVYLRSEGAWELVHRHADPLAEVQDALPDTGWTPGSTTSGRRASQELLANDVVVGRAAGTSSSLRSTSEMKAFSSRLRRFRRRRSARLRVPSRPRRRCRPSARRRRVRRRRHGGRRGCRRRCRRNRPSRGARRRSCCRRRPPCARPPRRRRCRRARRCDRARRRLRRRR